MEGNILLPPGFRFQPNDDELIKHYLWRKIADPSFSFYTFKEIDIYAFNPEELVEKYGNKEDYIHYFFTPTKRRYQNGCRPNRCTSNGHWKATGGDTEIIDQEDSNLIGYRKSLAFHIDKIPNLPKKLKNKIPNLPKKKKSVKTDWLMQEFRTKEDRKLKNNKNLPMQLDDWVICKIYKGNRKDSKRKQKEAEGEEEEEALMEGQGDHQEDIGIEEDIIRSMEDDQLVQYISELEQCLPLDVQYPYNQNICDPDGWDYGNLYDVSGSITDVGECSTTTCSSTVNNQNGYATPPVCTPVNANDQLCISPDHPMLPMLPMPLPINQQHWVEKEHNSSTSDQHQEFRTVEDRKRKNNTLYPMQLDDGVICKRYKRNGEDSKGKEKEVEGEEALEGQGEEDLGIEDIIRSMKDEQDNSLGQYFSNFEQFPPSSDDFEYLNGSNSDMVHSFNNISDPDGWDYGSLFDVSSSITEAGECSTGSDVNNQNGYDPMCKSVNASDQPMLPMPLSINQQPWAEKEHTSTSDQHQEGKDSSCSSD